MLSGALLALSFPKFGHPAAGWVALAPLLVAVPGAPLRRALALGFLTGVVYFTGTLYWLVEVMTTFGGLNTLTAAGSAALLIIYLSLYPALFAMTVAWLSARLGLRALALAPAVWVATELGRMYVWSGFPWALLGYSQATVLPVAQAAAVVGVFGLSLLVCAVSAALAHAWIRRRPLPLAGTVVAVLVIAAWGAWRVSTRALVREGHPIRVGVVQANIEQEDKWNPALSDAIFERYLAMSRRALADRAEFVIWPESSTPFYFENDPRGLRLRTLAQQSRAPFLIGSDQIEPVPLTRDTVAGTTPQSRPENRFYNAAFLVGPDGATSGVYRKMHLVPFGEYVPLKRLLFFVGPLVEAVSDFSPGDSPSTLPIGGRLASVAICYEVIYPSLIRSFVSRGSELLTTITNDAWYGRSSAAYQHWEQASLRAIEEGRYLARAANTGISGFVDPYGRVLAASALFEQTVLVEDLQFIRARTIYSRTGDLVAWLCLLNSGFWILYAGRRA
ncbi:MAG: apolipoprotein N-acyltransferase [Vicinamibacterales bacterium]